MCVCRWAVPLVWVSCGLQSQHCFAEEEEVIKNGDFRGLKKTLNNVKNLNLAKMALGREDIIKLD